MDSRTNQVKLIDFGFSAFSSDFQLPVPLPIFPPRLSGKEGHRAPELNSKPTITYESDIFACGSTYYEILHGGRGPLVLCRSVHDAKWDNKPANPNGEFNVIYGMLASLIRQRLWNTQPCARVSATNLLSSLDSCFKGTYEETPHQCASCASFGAGSVASTLIADVVSASRRSSLVTFMEHALLPHLRL